MTLPHLRPDSLTIELLQNGIPIKEVEVITTNSQKETYNFLALPKYESDGTTEYIYTVRLKDTLKNYEVT